MALVRCLDCGTEVAAEQRSCPTCARAISVPADAAPSKDWARGLVRTGRSPAPDLRLAEARKLVLPFAATFAVAIAGVVAWKALTSSLPSQPDEPAKQYPGEAWMDEMKSNREAAERRAQGLARVRAGGGVLFRNNGESVSTLEAGTELRIVGKSNGVYEVRVLNGPSTGRSGSISAKFVERD